MILMKPIFRKAGGPSRWLGVLLALTVVSAATPAHATGIQFAVFQQLPTDKNPYTFTNNGNGTGTFTAKTTVLFNFTSASGVADTSIRALTLELNATTNVAGAKLGNLIDQSINGQPPAGGLNSIKVYDAANTNYLTATFTGDITGQMGSSNATFAGDTQTNNIVNYSSSFVNFSSGASFLIGLPTVTLTDIRNPPPPGSQGLQLGVNSILASFVTNAQGSFSANLAVPVPTSAVMFGTGLAATAVLSRWRRRQVEPVGV